MSRIGEGGSRSVLGRRHLEAFFDELGAQPSLVSEEPASGLAVDATSQAGDDRFAVLGKYQREPFLEPADLLRPEDRNVLPGEGAAGHRTGLPGAPGDPDLPD